MKLICSRCSKTKVYEIPEFDGETRIMLLECKAESGIKSVKLMRDRCISEHEETEN